MKLITKAALMLVLTTPTCSAFVPQNIQSRPTAFYRQSTKSLASTTVKTEEMLDVVQEQIAREAASTVLAESAAAELSLAKSRASISSYLSQYEGQTGADIVYSKLKENGVEVVNGYSGGAVLPLLDQFHKDHPRHKGGEPPIRWITNSNESSAGHIAEGIAKSTQPQKVGVVVATSGPGLTNLITPLQDAMCDGVPVLAMCGQAATNAPPDAFQQAPAVDLTRPCTKWSYQIRSAAEVPLVMDYAFFVAMNGRPGPVFIDLPKDLLIQKLDSDLLDKFVGELETNDDQADFARFVTGSDKQQKQPHHALRLGTPEKGMAFVVDSDKKLKPAPRSASPSKDKVFHKDQVVTNRILHNEMVINGEERRISHQGDLSESSDMTHKLLEWIQKAERPVIIAGQGSNDCPDDLKRFAEKLQIPVTTTLHGLGCFDERHELALNMCGMHGHPTPNFMMQESDLIISVGSRFDDRITGRMNSFAPKARGAASTGGIVHVDVRWTEHGKQLQPTYFVHSTGKNFLKTMNAILDQQQEQGKLPQSPTQPWLKHMKELQQEYPVKIPHFETQQVPNDRGTMVPRTLMSAQSVLEELNAQLVRSGKIEDAIFTTGVGVHQMIAAQLITWTQPRQMISSGSLGTMGVALGFSIGAKLANGKRLVIAVDGDGSFNMTFTELKTVAEQGIPVKIMILDNSGQMMVEYWQRLFQGGRYVAVRNEQNPDYQTLAKAFGIKSLYCDAQEDLAKKVEEFLFEDTDKPVVFHVRIERTPCLPLVAPGQPLDDMILEDVTVDVDPNAAPS